MSWDSDAMSVLPEDWQKEVIENFTPEFLAEKLSDYVVILEEKVEGLESVVCKIRSLAEDGEGDHAKAPYCCVDIANIAYETQLQN